MWIDCEITLVELESSGFPCTSGVDVFMECFQDLWLPPSPTALMIKITLCLNICCRRVDCELYEDEMVVWDHGIEHAGPEPQGSNTYVLTCSCTELELMFYTCWWLICTGTSVER